MQYILEGNVNDVPTKRERTSLEAIVCHRYDIVRHKGNTTAHDLFYTHYSADKTRQGHLKIHFLGLCSYNGNTGRVYRFCSSSLFTTRLDGSLCQGTSTLTSDAEASQLVV